MQPVRVVPYRDCSADAKRWDDFVPISCNGNFLHSRRFLSYHGNRFEDCSVFLEDGKGRLIGLFPAAVLPDDRGTVCSHPGATYGGIVHKGGVKEQLLMEEMVAALIEDCRRRGFGSMLYKEVPHIYTRVPANSDCFALFRAGFRLEQCNLASVISPFFCKPSKRREGYIKSLNDFSVHATDDCEKQEQLWQVIERNMYQRYKARPTHSWQEMQELCKLFPESINFVVGEIEGSIEGGCVCFDFAAVIHIQYMAASENGKKNRTLYSVVHHLRKEAKKRRKWLSSGSSNNMDGSLNADLHMFKSGFGGGGVAHNIYMLDL